jgi:hypothetical protein
MSENTFIMSGKLATYCGNDISAPASRAFRKRETLIAENSHFHGAAKLKGMCAGLWSIFFALLQSGLNFPGTF